VADWDAIAQSIAAATGRPFVVRRRTPVGGGCINAAFAVSDGTRRYFVKTHDAAHAAMFAAETKGLALLAAADALRVPMPVCHGTDAHSSWLVLEHVEFGSRTPAGERALGQALAALHRHTAREFGLDHDNFIGASPQPNAPCADWATFWRDRRLGAQLALARDNGLPASLVAQGERVREAVPALLAGHSPAPSLLHGDLWGGNAAYADDGTPVIFDPAAYYGDRETDIAMTELFGGFGPDFHAAYRAAWPLPDGYGSRRGLYNLYHVLNHANLFGGGYVGQAQRMMAALLAAAP
jgi:fructosamine-3-kinase